MSKISIMATVAEGVRKQLARAWVRLAAFVALLAISSMAVSLGLQLWLACAENMKGFDEAFTTIGTARQTAIAAEPFKYWSAAQGGETIMTRHIYSSPLNDSVLDFDGAKYVHAPKKRPYYGAMSPGVKISQFADSYFTDINIIEIEAKSDCVPSQPTKVSVKRVLYGAMTEGEIWFCDIYEKFPKPLLAGRRYVVLVFALSSSSFEGFDEPGGSVYYPMKDAILPRQYDKNGERLSEEETELGDWEQVTEGYYETERGRRWGAMIASIEMAKHKVPVLPTDSLKLIVPFHEGAAAISAGREISEEEFESGGRVCMISQPFAHWNGFDVGDSINLQMYYAEYRQAVLPYSPLNMQGEPYPVFDEGMYTIVGIYSATVRQAYDTGADFDLTDTTVIIPAKSVQGTDEGNIAAFGRMTEFDTSFQISNGSVAEFMEAFKAQGIENIEFTFYDNGYSNVMEDAEAMESMSLALLAAGLLGALLILFFFTRSFTSALGKSTAINRALGAGRAQCVAAVLAGLAITALAGAAAGCAASGFLLGAAADAISSLTAAAGAFSTAYSNWGGELAMAGAKAPSAAPALSLSLSPSAMAAVTAAFAAIAAVLGFCWLISDMSAEPIKAFSLKSD
jgi:hypothetical protein